LTLTDTTGVDYGNVSSQVMLLNSGSQVAFTPLPTGSLSLDSVLGYADSDGTLVFSNIIDGGTY